jgi:hypothetical protein
MPPFNKYFILFEVQEGFVGMTKVALRHSIHIVSLSKSVNALLYNQQKNMKDLEDIKQIITLRSILSTAQVG